MFKSDLHVVLVGWNKQSDRPIWRLTQPLLYLNTSHGLIAVPAGFHTDFCSVPRHPSFVYGLFGDRLHRVGVLHDYAFCIDSIPQFTFEEANNLFLEAGLQGFEGEASKEMVEIMTGVLNVASKAFYHKRKVEDFP